MTKGDFIRVTTYAAVFGLIGGMTFQGANYAYNKRNVQETQQVREIADTEVPTVSTVSSNTDGSGSVSDVAQNVLPSIVAIDVTVSQKASDIFGRTYEQDAEGSGSGIIVGQDSDMLYIATNNHVVTDAKSVSVKFNDESVVSATVKGTDPDSDLAVACVSLKELSKETLANIKVATLGNSDNVKVGDRAIAIGNALGYGTSVTVGYISAKEREVAAEDVTMKLIQTDAAINPGNSGGALVDAAGAVIGINSAKYADEQVEGMGFAIPISAAVPIINDIIDSETIAEAEQGYLGIRGNDVSDEYSQYYNIPKGVYVGEVSQGSPAEEGGMIQGDIIVKFDGKDIASMTGLQDKLSRTKAGTKVSIVVKRSDNGEYKEKTLTVTLGKKADAESSSQEGGSQQDNQEDAGNGSGFSPYGYNRGERPFNSQNYLYE